MDNRRSRLLYNDMLKTVNLEAELERFAEEVIKKSKANLKRLNKKASGDLQNKMDYEINVSENSFSLGIGYPENQGGKYAKFVNYGVKGTKSGKSLKNYKYTTKKPPMRFLRTWLKQKSGRFRSRNLTSDAFKVQNIIYQRGIMPTEYYSKPFQDEFKKLPQELTEAFGLDVEDFIEFVIKE